MLRGVKYISVYGKKISTSKFKALIHLIELVTLSLNTIADKKFFGKIAFFFVECMVKMENIFFSTTKTCKTYSIFAADAISAHSKKNLGSYTIY